MGFKAVVVYALDFEDTPYDGLVVKAKSLPVGRLREIIKYAKLKDQRDPELVAEMLDDMLVKFSEALVSWNAEDENDQPIPATLKGLQALDTNMVLAIVLAWIEAVAGVSGPLGKPSSNGDTFQEGSIPMEPLSLSQAS